MDINARVKLKRDTESDWSESDPVLLDGERIIVDMPDGTIRGKTGDGIKRYSELSFDDVGIYNYIDDVVGDIALVLSTVVGED